MTMLVVVPQNTDDMRTHYTEVLLLLLLSAFHGLSRHISSRIRKTFLGTFSHFLVVFYRIIIIVSDRQTDRECSLQNGLCSDEPANGDEILHIYMRFPQISILLGRFETTRCNKNCVGVKNKCNICLCYTSLKAVCCPVAAAASVLGIIWTYMLFDVGGRKEGIDGFCPVIHKETKSALACIAKSFPTSLSKDMHLFYPLLSNFLHKHDDHVQRMLFCKDNNYYCQYCSVYRLNRHQN